VCRLSNCVRSLTWALADLDLHLIASGSGSEAAGRVTRVDKARAYAIARGECVECVTAVEIAVAAGDGDADALNAVVSLGATVLDVVHGFDGPGVLPLAGEDDFTKTCFARPMQPQGHVSNVHTQAGHHGPGGLLRKPVCSLRRAEPTQAPRPQQQHVCRDFGSWLLQQHGPSAAGIRMFARLE
jgi:hypothetical protein